MAENAAPFRSLTRSRLTNVSTEMCYSNRELTEHACDTGTRTRFRLFIKSYFNHTEEVDVLTVTL